MMKPVESSSVSQVASISANNDQAIGDIIAEAMEKVGKDGVITVEEGKSMATELDVVEGMQFDRGYLSPYFVTDKDSMECVLEHAVLLIHEKKISSMKDMLPVLEAVSRQGRPLLIVAEDVDGEALATLVVNKLRGTLNVAAVKAPGFGDRRKAMLEDIAILTGGRALMEETGIKLEGVQFEDLGQASRIVIDKDNTTIVEGDGERRPPLEAVSGSLRKHRSRTPTPSTAQKLQERLASWCGGVAVINVGAGHGNEMKEKKRAWKMRCTRPEPPSRQGIRRGAGASRWCAPRNALADFNLRGRRTSKPR